MDVKGMVESQAKIAQMLKSSYENNRLSHAYLFYGEDGVGKKEMAYYLAMLINCKDNACMECHTCRSIMANEFINVHYIGILDKKKLISKTQIEELQDEFAKTSLVAGARIYIIDGIDTASLAAQNSLLKFIEDPVNGEETYGIFIASDVSNVISTIQSRCSLVYFKSLPKQVICNYLIERNVPLDRAHLVSLFTNSPSEAKELAEDKSIDKLSEAISDFLKCEDGKDGVIFLKTNNTFFSDVKALKLFFKWLQAFYEDMILFYNKEEIYLIGYEPSIIAMCKKYDYSATKANFEMITQLARRIDYNVVPKNIMHELIVNLLRK